MCVRKFGSSPFHSDLPLLSYSETCQRASATECLSSAPLFYLATGNLGFTTTSLFLQTAFILPMRTLESPGLAWWLSVCRCFPCKPDNPISIPRRHRKVEKEDRQTDTHACTNTPQHTPSPCAHTIRSQL